MLLRGITIVYYKLVPWLSYALVMFFLLLLDYSVSSCLLLAWLLITISQQILFGSKVENYQRLYWLWLVYLRLTALQIVLRYVFEFAKFDIIYVVL